MTKTFWLLAILFVSTVYAEDTALPSPEFIEFLGEWEATDGQWQDPTILLDMDVADLEHDDNEQVFEEQEHD